MDIKVGDIIRTKKNHPCGNDEFEIVRMGMDFKIRCTKCQKLILISRKNIEKKIIYNVNKKLKV